jgi:diguanylate cyclase (GGDEF)-like protein
MNASPKTKSRLRVAVIDENLDVHKLICIVLNSQDVDVVCASDKTTGWDLVHNDFPDLVLLAYDSAGIDGIEICDAIKSQMVPFVFMVENCNHQIIRSCFQAGAVDFIRKPLCSAELLVRVGAALDQKRNVRPHAAVAQSDPLTHLHNRTSIREYIQSAIARADLGRCALFLLDVDRFKLVNSGLGYDYGDQLLQQIADRLIQTLSEIDLAGNQASTTATARLGGDEFAIFLQDLPNPARALEIAGSLLDHLKKPYTVAGHRVDCTVSIGVVNLHQRFTNPDAVLRDADTALHHAKAAGKGRYAVFEPAMTSAAEERFRIENELRGAIAREELRLEYQPIVSLDTGRTEAFEALVRWMHPERGIIPPMKFLPVAEESGLIVPLGDWVLDRACRDLARWRRTFGDAANPRIHVNVSRKQLSKDLVARVRRTLEKHAVPPDCLHLEVTESEIMQNAEIARMVLQDIRQLGVKIDMDDFGTGHSSLACLQELPIDVLKIDRTFVVNMERRLSFAALVHAIITLGHNLGMVVVAEGIETSDQLAMLQSMECDFGQGYFFAKPLRVDEVEKFFHELVGPCTCSW